MIFIFSFIWSAGGNIFDDPKDNPRAKFSNYVRSKIIKIYMGLDGEVYDCYPNFEEK